RMRRILAVERTSVRNGAATWIVALAAATLVTRGVVHPAPARAALAAVRSSAGEDVVAPHSLAISDAGRRSLRGGTGEEPGPGGGRGGGEEGPRGGGPSRRWPTTKKKPQNTRPRRPVKGVLFPPLSLSPPLIEIDPDTLELVPMLAAERPVVSADRLSYTFK